MICEEMWRDRESAGLVRSFVLSISFQINKIRRGSYCFQSTSMTTSKKKVVPVPELPPLRLRRSTVLRERQVEPLQINRASNTINTRNIQDKMEGLRSVQTLRSSLRSPKNVSRFVPKHSILEESISVELDQSVSVQLQRNVVSQQSKDALTNSNKPKSPNLEYEMKSVLTPALSNILKCFRNQETLFKYFTYGAILAPSLIAVVIPSRYWGLQQKDLPSLPIDIISLVANGLTVILVSIIIRTVIEWPWEWRSHLMVAKLKICRHITTSLAQGEKDLEVSVSLLRDIISRERHALFACLGSSILGSLLMYGAKTTITVSIHDDLRRSIIFNNGNITLFQCWLVLRFVLAISTGFEENPETTDIINLKLKYTRTAISQNSTRTVDQNLEPASEHHMVKSAKFHGDSPDDVQSVNSTLGDDDFEPPYFEKRPSAIYLKPYPLNLLPTSCRSPLHSISEDVDQQRFGIANAVLEQSKLHPLILSYEGELDDHTTFPNNMSESLESGSNWSTVHTLAKKVLKRLLPELILRPIRKWRHFRRSVKAYLLKHSKSRILRPKDTFEITKGIIWEMASVQFMKRLKSLDEFQARLEIFIKPVRRLKDFTILIMVRIPFNTMRFFVSVTLFFPKIYFKVFVLYPILYVRDRVRRNRAFQGMFSGNDSSQFTGLKLFRLQSPKGRSHKRLFSEPAFERHYSSSKTMKTRAAILHKLSKRFDIDGASDTFCNEPRTPVQLFDRSRG